MINRKLYCRRQGTEEQPWKVEITDSGELLVIMGESHSAYFGDMENTCSKCHINAELTAKTPVLFTAAENLRRALIAYYYGQIPNDLKISLNELEAALYD